MYTRNDEIVSKTGNLTSYTTRQTIASCIYLPSTHSFRIRKVLDLSYEDNLTQTSRNAERAIHCEARFLSTLVLIILGESK